MEDIKPPILINLALNLSKRRNGNNYLPYQVHQTRLLVMGKIML